MSDKLNVNNIEALNNALDLNMEKNTNIILYGQDVGYSGGVFKATHGLQKKYGNKRVFDAPLSEAAIVGSAIGMSIIGFRPIVEIQFQGFSYPAFQQIMTHAARMRNRSRGRYSCGLIIRMPMGGGINALEHHSESIEALFAHVPGLKIVIPSNPYDTKGLLTSALNCNDPIIFLEPKRIYRLFRQQIPKDLYEVPIGKANVLTKGDTITIVSYGALIHECLLAIDKLKSIDSSISIELIDLRTIKPLDLETIVNSVKKTGRILVVHEAVKSFSVSAEIITSVIEKAFYNLRVAPSRLTGWDITVPYAQGEKYHIINADRIVKKIIEIISIEE